jgi:uncharacterized protein HemX
MNQAKRGPAVLITAAVFMLFAIVAYLVGDAEGNNQRHEAILREQNVLRDQDEQSIADRAALHEQDSRFAASRTEICRQKKVTVDLQRRLDEVIAEVAVLRGRLEDFDRSRNEQTDHK